MQNPGAPRGPVDQAGRIRVGDVERDQAVAALAEHYVAGRLDLPEFEERTAATLAAKTRFDLETMFLDLPATAPPIARPGRRRRRKLRLAIAAACMSVTVGVGITGFQGGASSEEAFPVCPPEAVAGPEEYVCLEPEGPP